MLSEKKFNKEQCKEILEKNGNSFTDDELLKIREFLYKMAKIIINHNTKSKK